MEGIINSLNFSNWIYSTIYSERGKIVFKKIKYSFGSILFLAYFIEMSKENKLWPTIVEKYIVTER